MHKEDYVFYPMVDKELSDGGKQYLFDGFRKEDSKAGGKILEKARSCSGK
ncbi:MAG: hypothetical protein JSV16_10415 [Candidatus Hydrogenedentota bacterium]|nr:MAG: hypothetical protein JSV16_10415 [Candidatus Hydrogenedentota bacterium]